MAKTKKKKSKAKIPKVGKPTEVDESAPLLRYSVSKLKTFRRCKKQAEYKYVRGLKKKDVAVQLKRGSWLHELLEMHYSGGDWVKRHKELTKDFNNLFEEEREEYGDLPGECARIFRSYLDTYREVDKDWEVLAVEIDQVVPLPGGREFNFIIDLIVREPDGSIWLIDHKTQKNFNDDEYMALDVQLASYFWAAKQLGIEVTGVMFNELITNPPTPPRLLKNGKLTEAQNMRCDVYTYYKAIKQHGLEVKDYKDTLLRLKGQHERWFRRTRLPRDPQLTVQVMAELLMSAKDFEHMIEAKEYPRSPDKGCVYMCDFKDICITELHGGDASDIVRSRFTTKEQREQDGSSKNKKR